MKCLYALDISCFVKSMTLLSLQICSSYRISRSFAVPAQLKVAASFGRSSKVSCLTFDWSILYWVMHDMHQFLSRHEGQQSTTIFPRHLISSSMLVQDV